MALASVNTVWVRKAFLLDGCPGHVFYHSFYYDQRHVAYKVDQIALAVLNQTFDWPAFPRPLKCERYRAKSWAGRDERQMPCIYVALCDDYHGENADRAIMLSTVVTTPRTAVWLSLTPLS